MSEREPWFSDVRRHVAHIARGCRSGVAHNPAVHEQAIEQALAKAERTMEITRLLAAPGEDMTPDEALEAITALIEKRVGARA